MAINHDVRFVVAGGMVEGSPTRDELERLGTVRTVNQLIGEGRLGVLHHPGDGEARHGAIGQHHIDAVASFEVLQIEEDARAQIRVHMPEDDGRTDLTRRRSVDVPTDRRGIGGHDLVIRLQPEFGDARRDLNRGNRQSHGT